MVPIPFLFLRCACCGRLRVRTRMQYKRGRPKLCRDCCTQYHFRCPADYNRYAEIRWRESYMIRWL